MNAPLAAKAARLLTLPRPLSGTLMAMEAEIGQGIDDRAGIALTRAARPQGPQLGLQGPQFGDPCLDMADVGVQQAIDLGAFGLPGIAEGEQGPHFGQVHVQGATVADEE